MSKMSHVVEVLSQDSLERQEMKRARDRLRSIIGSSEEQTIALGAPNDARGCVTWPAVFKGGDNDG